MGLGINFEAHLKIAVKYNTNRNKNSTIACNSFYLPQSVNCLNCVKVFFFNLKIVFCLILYR